MRVRRLHHSRHHDTAHSLPRPFLVWWSESASKQSVKTVNFQENHENHQFCTEIAISVQNCTELPATET